MISVGTSILANNYFTILFSISNCDWRPPGKNFIMVGCDGVISNFYRVGALYLDIDKRMSDSLKNADVIITGNSTTINTFMLDSKTNLLTKFFENLNMTYYILAQEGSGFRIRQLLGESLKLKNKIIVTNIDDFMRDVVEDDNHDIVFNPDRYRLPFTITYMAIKLQNIVCKLKHDDFIYPFNLIAISVNGYYCNGPKKPVWIDIKSGTLLMDMPRNEVNRTQIVEKTDTQMREIDLYMRRASQLFRSSTWSQACNILYFVPSPNSAYEVARTISRKFGFPFVMTDVTPEKNYWSYDNSHMELDTSIRWTNEFLPILESEIHNCKSMMR